MFRKGKRASRNAYITAIGRSTKNVSGKPSDTSSIRAHKTKLVHIVTLALDGGENPHLFRNIKATTPKINDIPVGTQ